MRRRRIFKDSLVWNYRPKASGAMARPQSAIETVERAALFWLREKCRSPHGVRARAKRRGRHPYCGHVSASRYAIPFPVKGFDVILAHWSVEATDTTERAMAQQNSFDIVSEVDRAEITNAINQTVKEVRQRFDFKGSAANVALEENALVLTAEDETRLRNMNDILQQKLVRRGVPLKAFNYGKAEPAAGGTIRQRVDIQQGIPQDKAKEVVKFIKDTKAKVQSSIQGDTVRVTGKDRDVLQDIIARLKTKDFGINMQFTNYRSN